MPAESRLHKTAAQGPQVDDEYLYKVVDALDEVAKETGKPVPQVALNWLLQRPTVSTVIIGARNESPAASESGCGRLELDSCAGSQAGCRQQDKCSVPVLASAAIRRAQPSARSSINKQQVLLARRQILPQSYWSWSGNRMSPFSPNSPYLYASSVKLSFTSTDFCAASGSTTRYIFTSACLPCSVMTR